MAVLMEKWTKKKSTKKNPFFLAFYCSHLFDIHIEDDESVETIIDSSIISMIDEESIRIIAKMSTEQSR